MPFVVTFSFISGGGGNMHTEVRGQFTGGSSLLPVCGVLGIERRLSGLTTIILPSESSHSPYTYFQSDQSVP